MKFASIGSGSEGNGTLIKSDSGCLMHDCGFSAKEALARMANLGVGAEDLCAILVTHEHSDHIKGVARLANKIGVPVYATWGTWASKLQGLLHQHLTHIITPHDEFRLANIVVRPLPVPHDAKEPCQFVFESQSKKLGVVTDTGAVTPHMVSMYQGCDSLMLECNHDLQMLADGPYPASLKRRVAGPLGHLNNQQAAQMLSELDVSVIQNLVVTHISQRNNHPQLAVEALLSVEGCEENTITVAQQTSGFDWLEVEAAEAVL